MEKKIGIFTLDGIVNYGNRLQNYAVQTILEKMGYKAETIIAKDSFIKYFVNILRTIYKNPARSFKFISFNHKYINIKRVKSQKGQINSKLSKSYDYFVVGSDQVWNPNIRKRERDIFFLRFAEGQQRIALSASLSVEKIETKDIENYKSAINDFKNVSVREYSAADIIKSICDRDVDVLCDPTLALDVEDWDKLANQNMKNLPKKYLLMYFLGDVSPEIKKDINEYAGFYDLEIINLKDMNKCFSGIGPREFIGLIKKAELICTDSFHGVAFSTIYNKPFWAFRRNSEQLITMNMESRVASLQKKLGIEGHLINRLSLDMDYKMEYDEINKRKKDEQQKIVDFLSRAFEKQE